MPQPIPSKDHKYLHLLLLMSLVVELLDDIEDTPHYKHGIKVAAKRFIAEVSPVINKEMMMLCRNVEGASGKSITNMLIEHESFIRELCNHFTSDFPVLQAILEQYRNDPDFCLKQLDIAIMVKDPEIIIV